MFTVTHSIHIKRLSRKRLRSIAFIAVSLITFAFGSGGVYALTGDDCPQGMSTLDCNSLIGGWMNWVPDDGSSACGSTTLTGTDNEQKAFNFLTSPPQNLTGIAAAGVVGNLMAESGVDPTRVQNGKDSPTIPSSIIGSAGYGIAQWTSSGRQENLIKYAHSQGKQEGDLQIQLQFLWKEATSGYKDVIAHIQAAKTPEDAATQWMGPGDNGSTRTGGFENPASAYANESVRRSNAAGIYKLYGKDTPTDAAVSTGTSGANCDGVISGNFVEYKQCNYPGYPKVPWANAPYGGYSVCDTGCGPSAMAMIITNLTGQKVTPDMTAKYGADHGTSMPGGGSYWTLPQVVGSHWGLKSKEIGKSVSAINQTLHAGGLVLATGQGPNPFTSAGHFIVIRSVTSNGQWMTGNSAGYDDSKPYNTSEVIASMQNAWALTK